VKANRIIPVNFHEASVSWRERQSLQIQGFRPAMLDEEVIALSLTNARRSAVRIAIGAPLGGLRGSYQAVTMSMVPLVSRACYLLWPHPHEQRDPSSAD